MRSKSCIKRNLKCAPNAFRAGCYPITRPALFDQMPRYLSNDLSIRGCFFRSNSAAGVMGYHAASKAGVAGSRLVWRKRFYRLNVLLDLGEYFYSQHFFPMYKPFLELAELKEHPVRTGHKESKLPPPAPPPTTQILSDSHRM